MGNSTVNTLTQTMSYPLKSHNNKANQIKALKYAIASSHIVLEAKSFSPQKARQHNHRYT